MDWSLYLQTAGAALAAEGFGPAAPPAELAGDVALIGSREEAWGTLLLAVATREAAADPARRTALAAGAAGWAGGVAGATGRRCWALLVLPVHGQARGEPPDLAALGAAGPGDGWGAAAWAVDLDREVVDRHQGFPPVPDRLATILGTVPRRGGGVALRPAGAGAAGTLRRWAAGDFGPVPVTRFFVAANIAYYLWTLVQSGAGFSLFGGPDVASLYLWGANETRAVILGQQQWRLLTATFLHGGLLHLGFNMYALWSLGRYTELLFRSRQAAFIYVMAGLVGSVASVALRARVISVGASGAVFGLMGALVYFFWRTRGTVNWRGVLGPFGYSFLYGLMLGARVDQLGHFGGFVGGFLAAWVAGVPGDGRPWRTAAMGALALLALLVLLAVVPVPYLPLF